MDAGLYEYAKSNNLVINDRACGSLKSAWDKLNTTLSNGNITKFIKATSQPIQDLPTESEDETPLNNLSSRDELLEILNKVGKRAMSQRFMDICEIPHRIKNGMGDSYTVKSCRIIAQESLAEILRDEEVNIDDFINATKAYYSNGRMYRKTFSNYILDGDCVSAYDDYRANGISGLANNGTRSRYTV